MADTDPTDYAALAKAATALKAALAARVTHELRRALSAIAPPASKAATPRPDEPDDGAPRVPGIFGGDGWALTSNARGAYLVLKDGERHVASAKLDERTGRILVEALGVDAMRKSGVVE